MELLGSYNNGNTMNHIFSDGTRIRETEDDEFRFDFASNMDVKICNFAIEDAHFVMRVQHKMANLVTF